jgi:hypothetical protein
MAGPFGLAHGLRPAAAMVDQDVRGHGEDVDGGNAAVKKAADPTTQTQRQ